MKTCPNIDCTLNDQRHNNNDKYCWKCGSRLSSPHRCACGKIIDGIYIFCPKCGKKVIGKKRVESKKGE